MALVRTRQSGRSRILTLADPQRQNALSAEMVAAIEQVLEAAPQDLAALVVEGEGGVFSAGADLKSLSAALAKPPTPGETDPLYALNVAGGQFFARFAAAPFVTVAVVDGAAVGGGMGLAAAADIVLATPKARFALTETSLGIPPAQIAPYLVARLGERVARRLALTGARLDGREAAASGSPMSSARATRSATRGLRALLIAIEPLRAGRQRGDEAAVSRLPRRTAGRLYRDGGAELRRRVAWPRGAGRACGVRRQARAFLGEERQMSARFQSVLIANRGEIACRIIRAARAEGLRAIAVYSDADANAPHVRLADAAVRIGRRPAAESYLSIGALIDAAKATGAERCTRAMAFSPRTPTFAEACAAAGLVFVGPPPAAIRAMGDKSAAKRRWRPPASRCAPGYHGDDQSTARFADGGGTHRLSGDGQGDRRRRRARHAHRPRAGSPRGGARRGSLGGRERVRRRAAADRARAPRPRAMSRCRCSPTNMARSSILASATARSSAAIRR